MWIQPGGGVYKPQPAQPPPSSSFPFDTTIFLDQRDQSITTPSLLRRSGQQTHTHTHRTSDSKEQHHTNVALQIVLHKYTFVLITVRTPSNVIPFTMSDSAPTPFPTPRDRRNSFTPGSSQLSNYFSQSRAPPSAAGTPAYPGPITSAAAQATHQRRMSVGGGSPPQLNTSFGLRRGSVSSVSSITTSESAVDDENEASGSPQSPWVRRMSWGANALRDVRIPQVAPKTPGATAGSPTVSRGRCGSSFEEILAYVWFKVSGWTVLGPSRRMTPRCSDGDSRSRRCLCRPLLLPRRKMKIASRSASSRGSFIWINPQG